MCALCRNEISELKLDLELERDALVENVESGQRLSLSLSCVCSSFSFVVAQSNKSNARSRCRIDDCR